MYIYLSCLHNCNETSFIAVVQTYEIKEPTIQTFLVIAPVQTALGFSFYLNFFTVAQNSFLEKFIFAASSDRQLQVRLTTVRTISVRSCTNNWMVSPSDRSY